ncbi:MAG: hypothetical protein IPI03_12570 [Rubrivivax sp.]|nr:hypothetical protein [Rubrivivax sp.]
MPLSDGVTEPDQPEGTVQLYWPAALLGVQLAPLVAARLTLPMAVPLSVTVPLSWKVVGATAAAA